jgi:hypothetical protein
MKNFKQFINESKTLTYDINHVKNSVPAQLTNSQMVNFIDSNDLRDSVGVIDYNDAKQIANTSEKGWILTLMNMEDICDWVFEKPYKTSINIPAIVMKNDNEYEVLDGKTRLGYLNHIGIKQVYVYLGK